MIQVLLHLTFILRLYNIVPSSLLVNQLSLLLTYQANAPRKLLSRLLIDPQKSDSYEPTFHRQPWSTFYLPFPGRLDDEQPVRATDNPSNCRPNLF